MAGDGWCDVEDESIEEGDAVINHDRLARGGWLLAAGGLLLIFRLPSVEVIGWALGSLLVIVGVVDVSSAVVSSRLRGGFGWVLAAAAVAPLLEGLSFVVEEPVLLPAVAALVRVAGALVLSWATARRLDSARAREAARRWSATFAAQVATWIPIAVTLLVAAIMGEDPHVEGALAVGVFTVGASGSLPRHMAEH